MRIKVYVIDLQIPLHVKRWLVRLGVPAGMILVGGIAYGGNPPTFTTGETLQASDLNTMSTAIAALQSQIVPSGTIAPFGGSTVPPGWLLCDGSSVLQSNYPNLYAAIGNSWGAPGASSFNLPDLRGEFLRGVDSGAGRDPNSASRAAAATGGNTGDTVGSVQGGATAINGLGVSDPGHFHDGLIGGTAGTGNLIVSGAGGDNGQLLQFGGLGAGNTVVSTNSVTTGITLTSSNQETRPLNAYVNYIIKY